MSTEKCNWYRNVLYGQWNKVFIVGMTVNW